METKKTPFPGKELTLKVNITSKSVTGPHLENGTAEFKHTIDNGVKNDESNVLGLHVESGLAELKNSTNNDVKTDESNAHKIKNSAKKTLLHKLTKYSEASTCHGINYLCNQDFSVARRCLWAALWLGCWAVLLWLCGK